MQKFLIAWLWLVASLVLQYLAASFGWPGDLALAALIAFAFAFTWFEMLPFVAASVLMLNWQPAASPAMLVIALLPLALCGLRKMVSWEPWIAVPIAAAVGAALIRWSSGAASVTITVEDILIMAIWSVASYAIIAKIIHT